MDDSRFTEWVEEINNVDSEKVFSENGVTFDNTGKHFLNPCRNDKNFGSCHFYKGRAYDMAGSGVNNGTMIRNTDAVMAIYSCNFISACDIIAKQNGLPTYEEISKKKRHEKAMDLMPLTKRQSRYLGLQTYARPIIKGYMVEEKPKDRRYEGDPDGYIIGEEIHYNLNDLWNADKRHEGFWFIIDHKAKEMYQHYLTLYKARIWEANIRNKTVEKEIKAVMQKEYKKHINEMKEMYSLDTDETLNLIKTAEEDLKKPLPVKYSNPYAGMPKIKEILEDALSATSDILKMRGYKVEDVNWERPNRFASIA